MKKLDRQNRQSAQPMIARRTISQGASALLMPISCRRQLFDLSDDMATKIDIQFYSDARDALLKAISE